jgi:hypothetical protein
MKIRTIHATLVVLVAWICLMPGRSYTAESQPAAAAPPAPAEYPLAPTTKGFTCVFMGHSFFYRVANDLEKVAIGSGFTEHKQVVRVAHGIEGTPGWLWAHVGPKEEARRMLQQEKVHLLAISYHGRSPDQCRIEDYSKWIDLAREKNPDIMFAIGISWAGLYDPNITAEQYAAVYTRVAAPIYTLIDQLREKYPHNAIFAIPHGKGVFELYTRYKAGDLPEIKTLIRSGKGSPNGCFFLDTTYHAGPMALAVTRLIFMATIYQTDPRKSPWPSGFKADAILKQIAYDAVKGEPYARIVKGKQPANPRPPAEQADGESSRRPGRRAGRRG